jgi:hypothetical protein
MVFVTAFQQEAQGAHLRDEALLLLDKHGKILEIAREVSSLMRTAGIPGVVIGGIAVVLHGHIRTTKDVDVFSPPPLKPLADLLTAHGFVFDQAERAFRKHGVPVHLVLPEHVGAPLHEAIEIEGISTVPLADLIGMKLRSGSTNLLRAQDLADVIGLIRVHKLDRSFARRLDKALRPAFRQLVRMIYKEDARSS